MTNIPSLSLPLSSNLPTPPSILPSKPTLPSPYPIKRLTYSKMQQLRDQGLCLNCNDIDTPDHCCSIKRILLVMPDEDPTFEQQSMETVKPRVPTTLHFQTTVVNYPVVTLVHIEKQPLELFQPIVPKQLTGQEIAYPATIDANNPKAIWPFISILRQPAATLVYSDDGIKILFSCQTAFAMVELHDHKLFDILPERDTNKIFETKVFVFDPGGKTKFGCLLMARLHSYAQLNHNPSSTSSIPWPPTYDLEDKVIFRAGGNDIAPNIDHQPTTTAANMRPKESSTCQFVTKYKALLL